MKLKHARFNYQQIIERNEQLQKGTSSNKQHAKNVKNRNGRLFTQGMPSWFSVIFIGARKFKIKRYKKQTF
jgi:hypothetical protein